MPAPPALEVDVRSLWVWGGAALLALVALWQYFALRSRAGRAAALALASLRTGALALALFLLAGPQRVRRTLLRERPPLAVVVDTTRSMGLRGAGGKSRLEQVQAFLGSREFREASAGYAADYHALGAGAVRVVAEELPVLRATAERTDLPAGVAAAVEKQPENLAAVLLFTDGGHVVPGADEAVTAAGRPPLIVVGVGGGERPRDLEVLEVTAPAIAFAGQPARLQVRVRARGFRGREVPLLLRRGPLVLLTRTVRPDGDDETIPLELAWTPPAPGSYALTVQVPRQLEEPIGENNQRDLALEAVRDKIRVLLVCGSPTWNYRFLREALKGDPSVDLVSFIILRAAADAVDVPQHELSLIPFPTQKIFQDELSNFDLLVFDNFSYQPYLSPEHLEKVRLYVRAGGAFWMLGGPLAFSGGRYQGTPVAQVLPVDLAPAAAGGDGYVDVRFQGRLTPAGRTHPFFQGWTDPAGALPPLDGYNLTGPARDGAVTLAEIPLPAGGAQPLIVLGRYGQGRVLAVLADTLWKWSFEEAGRGRGNRPYLTFVRQAVRWSVGDPQLQPVKVELERGRLAPGERLRARVRVLGEDFLPARAAQLRVALRSAAGQVRALPASEEAPGVYAVEAELPEEGSFELTAEVSARGAVYGRASAPVSALWPAEEFRAPGLNREAVRALIGGGRGALLELGEFGETASQVRQALRALASGRGAVHEERRGLWEEWWVFALFLGVLGGEWALRKRLGID